ncbi:MAG: ribose-phosphate diphosphokinase [Armatimonadia bacterium]|jgi:ribose-phosphate pyrophosphokinase|nr:ribose-phosphate diphosphokinase [Armatimonadia bacterium]
MKLFTGSANPKLAADIAHCLGIPLGDAEVTHFSDGECRITIRESVRGCDVFLIQPTCAPTNDHLVELLIMLDACRRASARRITCVIPYYGYGRQDRKCGPREPITAKLIADMLVAAGASRVLSVELHADQIMGFFNIPVDQLNVGGLFADYVKDNVFDNGSADAVVVSPDVGGVASARQFADRLGSQLVIVAKRRRRANEVEVMEVIGDVEGKLCIFRDDMIDTGGSMVEGASALMKRGASRVMALGTHPVLSGHASKRLAASSFEKVIVSDTIPVPEERRFPQLEVLSVAPLLASGIRCIHEGRSVSSLIR